MQTDALEEQEQSKSETSRWVYVVVGCSILFLIAFCLFMTFIFLAPFILRYIDSNYIWCDVFGRLIPGCP